MEAMDKSSWPEADALVQLVKKANMRGRTINKENTLIRRGNFTLYTSD